MIEENPIAKLKAFVHDDIERVDEHIASLATSCVTDLIPSIVLYVTNSGGKRLRPALTIACAKICECKNDNHILLAAAVEFIHTATLLHDDVIDQSKIRRNRKTANNVWGDKASILVGDYLFSQAFKLMVKTGSIEALEVLSDAAATIAEGEVWQLQLIGDLNIKQEDYINLVRSKTATLFAAACKVGGVAAKAENNITSALYEFGLNFGIAFQIVDDFLDYFGDADEFGKEIGNDFLEGKVTLPIILAFCESNDSDKEVIYNSFCKESRSSRCFKSVKEILVRKNLSEKILKIADSYAQAALTAIDVIKESSNISLLREIAQHALNRRA